MIVYYWVLDESESYETLYALDTEAGTSQRIGVPINPVHHTDTHPWRNAGIVNGRMAVWMQWNDEADKVLRGVGAAPFDSGAGVYAPADLNASLDHGWHYYLTSWGFILWAPHDVGQPYISEKLVRVDVPASGAVTFNQYTKPAWLEGAQLQTVECAAGTRLVALFNDRVKVSNVLASSSTAWVEAASVMLPGGGAALPDEWPHSAALLSAALFSAVEGLGDSVIHAPLVYPGWNVYEGPKFSSRERVASVGGDILIAEVNEVWDDDIGTTDTHLLSYRLNVAGGVATLLETKTASTMALLGAPYFDWWRVYATDFTIGQPTFFWTGYKLASETP